MLLVLSRRGGGFGADDRLFEAMQESERPSDDGHVGAWQRQSRDRVGAAGLDELPDVRPEGFAVATMSDRFAGVGVRQAAIGDVVYGMQPLHMYQRDASQGLIGMHLSV